MKILTMVPVVPQSSEIETIAKSLAFLHPEHSIDFIDSMSIMEDLPNAAYYQLWEQELKQSLDKYDAFFGFSFGGVILQQCFSLFTKTKKPIVLFSTPTFVDEPLRAKLTKIISLCEDDKLDEALGIHFQRVYAPNIPKKSFDVITDQAMTKKRMIFGLTRFLATDSRLTLKENPVGYLHLFGEFSDLVNSNNVLVGPKGRVLQVPGASMRVLQDNPAFCQKAIMETLNGGNI